MSAGDIISLRGLALAVPLVAGVLLFGWWYARSQRAKKRKPGMFLEYEAPGKNAAACRGILRKPAPGDVFAYSMETTSGGGWRLHFTGHNPTGQLLDTLYLLQFEDDDPARFSLTFMREAFGMREPIITEALLDAFFAQKLGAIRAFPPEGEK